MKPEERLEYFSVYGGVEERVSFNFFEDLEASVLRHFVREFAESSRWVEPSYLRESPYRDLLTALARGDAKMLGAFRRAGLAESVGGSLLDSMVKRGVLELERSREAPVRPIPGRPIRRELRGYRIQDKVRFLRPFDRFWFGFVEPYGRELLRGEGQAFLENYRQHRDRAVSLVFEQLSNELLELHFLKSDPLLSKGSHWDYHSEFDLLAHTRSGRLILGECKYTGRPVCRSELKKLREKAEISGIRADLFVLFSRSGFSRELRESTEPDLLLFELGDFDRLLVE
jgi:hypothetical protein